MKRLAVAALWIAAILGLVALGTWQVQRLAWKRALIAQVDARLAAAPVAAPRGAGPDDAYRRVVATGRFVGADSFVQASTVRGPGWWVMTPLRTSGGRTILVNRGYVATRNASPPQPARPITVTGLLRLTEPGGGFLRTNDPVANRWFSRDVAAIAARHGLGTTAPYFIDADRSAPGGPVGGLTVVRFPNNHLPYAITWYILAIMGTTGFIYWIRLDRRQR